jgi:uncharacterized protein YifN (PemK superfamily)
MNKPSEESTGAARAKLGLAPDKAAEIVRKVKELQQKRESDQKAVTAAPMHPGAGSIASLLKLSGRYNEHGSFVPDARAKLRIREPKIREIYWCQFTDSLNPEFGKMRPVLIISPQNPLGTFSLVLPLSTAPKNPNDPFVHKLTQNPSRDRQGTDSWVVANHVYAVSHYRLLRFWDKSRQSLYTPRLSDPEFNEIVTKLYAALPKPPEQRRPTDETGAS